FYEETINDDEVLRKKHLKPASLEPLKALYHQFQKLDHWEAEALQACINECCLVFDLSMGKVAQPLRVALTGTTMSPSIATTLQFLGKARSVTRLKEAICYMEQSKDVE